MNAEIQRRIFRFGVFEADETTGELRKHGVRIRLHSQPFQLLVMLLEHPSEVVTREEMRHRLWGDDTFVDFDHGLNSAVNKLREALGDSASQPRHIETIAGKGYRYIGSVELAEPAARTPPVAAATTPGDGSLLSSDQAIPGRPPSATDNEEEPKRTILAAPHELPRAPRALVRTLFLLTQAMYLAFYVGALANLDEIRGILADAQILSPALLMALLVASAVVAIPVRLFLFAAMTFDFPQFPDKFRRLFPLVLILDLLWALSPFLLIHHINVGVALAMVAALVYLPFAQRSLVLMYARASST
ncbi:MAG TPA: winged helix-turn-helix domain-containing protein [Terriglobales bacterium]